MPEQCKESHETSALCFILLYYIVDFYCTVVIVSSCICALALSPTNLLLFSLPPHFQLSLPLLSTISLDKIRTLMSKRNIVMAWCVDIYNTYVKTLHINLRLHTINKRTHTLTYAHTYALYSIYIPPLARQHTERVIRRCPYFT